MAICETPTVRSTLIVLNLFCLLWGLSLAIVGVVMYDRLLSINNLTKGENLLTNETVLAMNIGWVVFAVAFFGFCGATRHSRGMTMAYAVMLMALIVIQIVVAVLLLASVEAGRKAPHDLKWFEEYFRQNMQLKAFGGVDPAIDDLQSTYECCGMDSYRDWEGDLPDSCCSSGKGSTCVPYEHGCKQVLKRYIKHVARTIGGILIGLTLFEFVLLGMACLYVCA